MDSTSVAPTSGRWPYRLALGAWLSALPLVVLGGTVTTLRQGMAIDGWWVLDRGHGDYFLLAYPVQRWFATAGTFSEHTHRLCGVLVGLFAIAYLVSVLATRRRETALVRMAALGLFAVCAQGALGGFRVLENSPQLAFLHGAFAQLVFALLGANVALASPAWRAVARAAGDGTVVRRWSWIAVGAVYAQIVLGAWLRHSGDELPMTFHFVFAALAAGAVFAFARAASETGVERLVRRARQLRWLVIAQLCLGGLATVAIFVVSGGFKADVSVAEGITATSHVLLGALLLQHAVVSSMWAHRLVAAEPRTSLTATASIGGAR
jgi:cytochrome c oxidase assembly protein subunit 15